MGFTPRQSWQRFARILGTGFGTGYVPFMPGTIGSLLGLPLVWVMQRLLGAGSAVFAVGAAVVVLLGIAVCHRARRDFEGHDPGQIVFDEIAAFPVVFLFVPITWLTAIYGFVWFRVFDITKPWPIRKLEKLPGGLGIMVDDLVAGILAAAALMFTVAASDMVRQWSASS